METRSAERTRAVYFMKDGSPRHVQWRGKTLAMTSLTAPGHLNWIGVQNK